MKKTKPTVEVKRYQKMVLDGPPYRPLDDVVESALRKEVASLKTQLLHLAMKSDRKEARIQNLLAWNKELQKRIDELEGGQTKTMAETFDAIVADALEYGTPPVEWAKRGSLQAGDRVWWVHHTGKQNDRHRAVIIETKDNDNIVRSSLVGRDGFEVSRSFGWSTEDGRYIAGRFGIVKG